MKIVVLLSTWNGEKYLRQQITSILAQKVDGTVEILVRDDGSADNTARIVDELNDGRIRMLCGPNLGAKRSFMALLQEAMQIDAEYVAFADQDDIWLPGKLQRAITQLQDGSGPALYCSALQLVDEELHPLDTYRFPEMPRFESSFLANCATGCTCVINREMLNRLASQPNMDEILMHDWWLYLVAAAFGRVVYDSESYILYRQHAANQIGMRTGWAGMVYRTRQFLKRSPKPSRLSQAQEFQRLYGKQLTEAQSHYLAQLVACDRSLLARLHFMVTHRPRRRAVFDELVSTMTFVLGR